MADEIRVSSSLTYSNGTLGALGSLTIPSRSQTITQNTAAPARVGGTQTIGFAAHEAVVVTDITTLGWAHFRNRDAANFVEIGVDVAAAFVPLVRLNAGEECIFRLAQGATVYAQADTGAVILDRDILDD